MLEISILRLNFYKMGNFQLKSLVFLAVIFPTRRKFSHSLKFLGKVNCPLPVPCRDDTVYNHSKVVYEVG